ncbi:hypothetical protein KDK95_25300 [Actinospica sp. MGRD01-02]|uniref:Uncharacterized protein n=1 Tax=Actinospica acidithermotolerans TaxID=2828514 RepID=A0A941IM40_9ACTN|nr:hypothetical protein [Actinospica acidithermotolerans]MBR7829648.1 hypothetical protein [Actinospica acidithermotolerans]
MRSGYEFGEYGRLTARPDRDPEHVLAGFLSKVADTAAPQLSPAARHRLLDTLRATIEQERAEQGTDIRALDRILAGLGDPVTLVDAEVQRDPESQKALEARLTRASSNSPTPASMDADVVKQLAPDGHGHGPVHPVGLPGSGPEICLDPDPFGMAFEYRPETVGALGGGQAAPEGAPAAAATASAPGELAVADRIRTFWDGGPKLHPVESLAIVLLLVGAIMGNWLVLLAAVLVAFASRFYSPAEKWLLLVGIPVVSFLLFTLGYWLNSHGKPGGTTNRPADLLDGVDSFFGPLPRMIALLGAVFLAWRLGRGVIRRS